MEVTSSLKTQIGGDDDEGGGQKKKIAFVAFLVVVLSITAWFFIQPLFNSEKPVNAETPAAAPAPVAKNPAKVKADDVAKTDAAPAAETPSAAPPAPAVATESTAVDPAATLPAAVDAATSATTSPAPASDSSVAALPASDALVSAVPIVPVAAVKSPSPLSVAQPGPLTTAEAVRPDVDAPIEVPSAETTEVTEKAEAPVDRWEKLRSENPGTVLPSADMWVFQTRKLKAKVYVVKHAESLKAISSKLLYSDRFWVKIWSLNPAVVDPDVVPVGTEIVLDPGARGTASH